ncbi:MAG: hypothetical protein J6D21_01305 [Clostridia bacterium]|nr:hypothetical protein [Clostridia bacterium]
MANEELEVKEGVVSDATGDLDAVKDEKKSRRLKLFWPRIITLVLAVIIWVFVMEINPPDAYKTYEDVPIKIMNFADAVVTPAEGSELTVDVTVIAKKNRINALESQQITLVIDTFGIEESGTYQLEILYVLPSGYRVHSLSQETITVNVELPSEDQ